MIPFNHVGVREVMALTPVLGRSYATLSRNEQHVATNRGRIQASCYGPRHRRPLHLASPVQVHLPMFATPHERLYDVRICVGVYQRPLPVREWPLDWYVTTHNRVGGGASTSSPASRVLVPSERVDVEGWQGRTLRPLTPVGVDPESTFPLYPIWSDWIRHECDASLAQQRMLELNLQWDGGIPATLPPTVLLGAVAIGYDDRELVGTPPADGSGIELETWGTWPGPDPYEQHVGKNITQEQMRGMVAAQHYNCCYLGRGHAGYFYGVDNTWIPLAKGTSSAGWTVVDHIVLEQRKHITGLQISVITESDIGGTTRVECLDTSTFVEITTGAGVEDACVPFSLARGDQVSVLEVSVMPGVGGAYHGITGINVVDRDMTEAELQALV